MRYAVLTIFLFFAVMPVFSRGETLKIESIYPSRVGTLTVEKNALLATDGSSRVGIGTTSPGNKLDVAGGVVVGSGYVSSNTAPNNGILVEGNVGIGVTAADATTARLVIAIPPAIEQVGEKKQYKYVRDSSKWTGLPSSSVFTQSFQCCSCDRGTTMSDDCGSSFIVDRDEGSSCYDMNIFESRPGFQYTGFYLYDKNVEDVPVMGEVVQTALQVKEGESVFDDNVEVNGDITINGKVLKTLTVKGSHNLNPLFPDALNGTIVDVMMTGGGNPIVPMGKTLYILNLTANGTIDMNLFIGSEAYYRLPLASEPPTSCGSGKSTNINFKSPLVVSEGQIISATTASGASPVRLVGYLVDSNADVEIVNTVITRDDDYTVSGGVLFILTAHNQIGIGNLLTRRGVNNNSWICTFTAYQSKSFDNPIIIPNGGRLRGACGKIAITGYKLVIPSVSSQNCIQ